MSSKTKDQKQLKILIEKSGLTQEELGKAMRLHQSAISRILNNQQRMDLTDAVMFSNVLNVSIDEVIRMYFADGGS